MTVQEWLGENNKIGIDIWNGKYKYKDETFEDWIERISNGDVELKNLILDKKFLMGGRALTNRGLKNEKGSYFNCYSYGYCPDDFSEIMKANSVLGLTYKAQGGQGISLSKLRPKGTPIGNRYTSDGIIPFMQLFNTTTSITSQAGSRKGALMISLDIRHKQAEEFIKVKTEENVIDKANLSLEIDDKFMSAVKTYYETGDIITLHEKRNYTGHIVEYDVVPINLYKLMIECANDWGEPGCIFTNRFRNYNLMQFVEEYQIETCNPSLRAGTPVLTSSGPVPIEQLEGKKFNVTTVNGDTAIAECFLSGKNKRLYKITLENNEVFYCTPEHKWPVVDDSNIGYHKELTSDLKVGDRFIVSGTNVISDGSVGTYDDGMFFGYWYGDGCVSELNDGGHQYGFTFGSGDKINFWLPFIKNYLYRITGKDYNGSLRNRGMEDWVEVVVRDNKIYEHFCKFGVYDKKHFPERLLTECSEQFRRGFVDGLLSSDGTVDTCRSAEKIGFCTSCEDIAYELKSLLGWYGIKTNVIKTSRILNLSGEEKEYIRYDVNITKGKIGRFLELFKLSSESKQSKIIEICNGVKKKNIKNYSMQIKNIELTDIYEDVWDIHVYDNTHTFLLNWCVTGNCGEQPLPKNFCCNLGSINLARFVINEYTNDAVFDFDGFSNAIKIAIRTLDKLIDENIDRHPIKEQRENSYNYRNIGLGVFGMADMLFKLRIKYGSKESKEFLDKLFNFMFREAVIWDVKLAKKLGVFPKYSEAVWDSEIIINHFSKEEIDNLKEYGLRNCSLLSIAPTGTIATMLGCSGGAEPEFAISYTRKTDNLKESYKIYCAEAQYYLDKFKTNTLPDYFVCSADLNWRDRIDVQGVIQNHIDTAISSTVNLPYETNSKEVEELYLYAWEKGLKGITIFRDGCKRMGILTVNPKDKKEEPKDESTEDNILKPYKLERGYIIQVDDNVVGKKRTLTTGCGKLHCEAFFDPVDGKLLEVYLSKGSTGGCNSFMIGLSRMISLSARGGVDIFSIVDQLNSCVACPSYAVRSATKKDTSRGNCCPMAIGNALLDMYNEMQNEISDPEELDDEDYIWYEKEKFGDKRTKVKKDEYGYPICPNCGERLFFEGGCNVCKSCGWSKCD